MSHERRQRPLLNAGTVSLGILLIVAAIGTLISVSHTNRVGSTATGVRGSLGAPLRISTIEQGAINCPYGAAFAPDGDHVAIIGSQSTCEPATSTLTPHIVAVYDTHSGVMTQYVKIEKLLGIDTSLPLEQQSIRAIHYFSLGWSPDGSRIAIIFTAFSSPDIQTPDTVEDSGLIVLDAEHGTARVWRGDSGYFALPGESGGGFPIWNVATGAEVPAYSPEPGLAFAWNSQGMPYPIVKARAPFHQLPITAGPRYPVGNPHGNSTFTIWQPGVVLGSASNTSAAIFTTVFPTWSPDGKYVTLMNAGAQLPLAQAPTPPNAATGSTGGDIAYPTPSVMASAPARDAALVAVQRRAGTRGWALVAWNPTGSMLASINCTTPSNETLEIRTTDSAIIQGSAELSQAKGDTGCRNLTAGASAFPAQPLMLLWAPTGNRVLVCDQKDGMLTIWPVNQPTV
jgi:WD40 repeat protein